MRPRLDPAAFLHHHETVEHGDGGQPVGEGDDGFAFHQRVALFLDGGLERRGGLVEDGGVLEEHPGDGAAPARAAYRGRARSRPRPYCEKYGLFTQATIRLTSS
jgi:hypothetical protein